MIETLSDIETEEIPEEEKFTIAPESEDELNEQLFPNAEVSSEKVAEIEQEAPFYMADLDAWISSYDQMKNLVDSDEFQKMKKYASLDSQAYEAQKNISEKGIKKEDVGEIISAWKGAHDNYERTYHDPKLHYKIPSTYWDAKSMHYNTVLSKVISPWKKDKEGNLKSKKYRNIAIFEDLISSEDFDKKEELTEYLTYRLWLKNNRVKLSSPYPGELERQSYKNNIREFEEEKKHVLPLVIKATKDFAEKDKNMPVRKVMENLHTMGEGDIAGEILLDPNLSDNARLNISVEQMNTFGIVPVIDYIAAHEENNEYMSKLYKTVQGEDLEEIMRDLTQVYKAVDFHEYVLNTPELTVKEIKLIDSEIGRYGELMHKDPKEVRILDIGAGTGRHCTVLAEEFYDITALEFESHHVNRIKKQNPDIKVIKADWQNIPYPDSKYSESASPEIVYCLGRTILHNNTPEKMAGFFDEVGRILPEEGRFIIDIPKIPEDEISKVENEYEKEINEYRDHLRSLGVENISAQNIFDGPDEKHKFNRMALTDSQLRAYAKLFGFEVDKVEETKIGEEDLFNNSYYVLRKNPDFIVDELPPDEFSQAIRDIGLLDPGVDYNKHVDAWDLPMGIPIMYMNGNQPESIMDMRIAYSKGRLGEISVKKDNEMIYLEVSHRRNSLF